MKLLCAVVLFFSLNLLAPLAAQSQDHVAHPLDGLEDFLRTDDLILFWSEGIYDIDSGDPRRELFSQIIYSNKKPGIDELIFQQHNTHPNTRYHRYNTTGFEPYYYLDHFHPSPVDVVTGDFNGDAYETFVGAYAGNGAIHFVLHELNPQRKTGDDVDNFDIQISNYAIRTATNSYRGRLFRLAAADLTMENSRELFRLRFPLAHRRDQPALLSAQRCRIAG